LAMIFYVCELLVTFGGTKVIIKNKIK